MIEKHPHDLLSKEEVRRFNKDLFDIACSLIKYGEGMKIHGEILHIQHSDEDRLASCMIPGTDPLIKIHKRKFSDRYLYSICFETANEQFCIGLEEKKTDDYHYDKETDELDIEAEDVDFVCLDISLGEYLSFGYGDITSERDQKIWDTIVKLSQPLQEFTSILERRKQEYEANQEIKRQKEINNRQRATNTTIQRFFELGDQKNEETETD